MALLMRGKPVADKMKADLQRVVNHGMDRGIIPRLIVVRVGARADDLAYEAKILSNCKEIGIQGDVVELDSNISEEAFLEILAGLNENPEIHGILLFRPLPLHWNSDRISSTISPHKDVDCMNPVNYGKIFLGDSTAMYPCTPEAVMELLHHYDVDLTGKHVVIVNRSMVLGKPLAMMMLALDATVTLCHSKTKDLVSITSKADIVITGVGKAGFFVPEHFSDQCIVVDVGINYVDGKLRGDVDFEGVSPLVGGISPVPGGIGTITSMILMKHVLKQLQDPPAK